MQVVREGAEEARGEGEAAMTKEQAEPVHYYYRWCSLARAKHGDSPGRVSKRGVDVTCQECLGWLANGPGGHRVTLEEP